MILISHRGNTVGRRSSLENTLTAIKVAIEAGYDVEIDVQKIDALHVFLGHDKAEHAIDLKTFVLLKDKLWCHAKNIDVLPGLIENGFNCFYHETDRCTLTSNGYIWTFPGNKLTNKSICLFPDKTGEVYAGCAGICSDNIHLYEAEKEW